MTESANTLSTRMSEHLQEGSFLVSGGRDLYMEVMDTATGLVWMSAAPVSRADFEALDIELPLVKVGVGLAAMDCAAFQSSPAAPAEPVKERLIDGRLYINVAAPMEQIPPTREMGPLEISVNKAHVVGFAAGRRLVVMSLPEGDYVELVGNDSADESLVLPEGAVLKRVELSAPWVVQLPTPTRTFFWFGDTMRSFQGPVTLPESAPENTGINTISEGN